MDLDRVVAYFGSNKRLAEKLGVSQAAISQWRRAGKIPRSQQHEIRIISKGKFTVHKVKV
jgi:DNA-binding transcriptional regulator YdaS (Cro superfamily)